MLPKIRQIKGAKGRPLHPSFVVLGWGPAESNISTEVQRMLSSQLLCGGWGDTDTVLRQRTAYVVEQKQEKDQHLLLVHILPIHEDLSAVVQQTYILYGIATIRSGNRKMAEVKSYLMVGENIQRIDNMNIMEDVLPVTGGT